MNAITEVPDTKELFWKLGTCSRTFYYILNREFGHLNDEEENASAPFAGGMLREGYQCGMLWGSTMAVGAESYRRFDDPDQAIRMAIQATQHLMKSFEKRTKTHNCRDIIHCNLKTKWGMMKLLVKSFLFRSSGCVNLAVDWAPEAIQAAHEGLKEPQNNQNEQDKASQHAISCASEVAEKMGASKEEKIIVAGLAGGMGLSGNACGALGAAIWLNSKEWLDSENGKTVYRNPKANHTLKVFKNATQSKFRCQEITGKCFKTCDEHTAFIKNGGCKELIDILANSKMEN